MLGQGVDAQLAQVVVDGFNGDVAALLVVGIVLMTMVEVYLSDVETVVSLIEAQIVGANAAVGTVLDVDKILLNSPEYVARGVVGGAASGESVNTLQMPEAVERSVVASRLLIVGCFIFILSIPFYLLLSVHRHCDRTSVGYRSPWRRQL